MAGVVAEILRFGDCKGGIEDIPVVYEIMRIEKIKSMKDKKGTLMYKTIYIYSCIYSRIYLYIYLYIHSYIYSYIHSYIRSYIYLQIIVGVLRWALLKALTLLKIYRDELDDVAWGMKNGVDVNELILDIENCPSPNSNSPSITSCQINLYQRSTLFTLRSSSVSDNVHEV